MGRNVLVDGEWQTDVESETVVTDPVRDQGYYQRENTPVGPDLDSEALHGRSG